MDMTSHILYFQCVDMWAHIHIDMYLAGGFNPNETYSSNWFHLPQFFGVNNKNKYLSCHHPGIYSAYGLSSILGKQNPPRHPPLSAKTSWWHHLVAMEVGSSTPNEKFGFDKYHYQKRPLGCVFSKQPLATWSRPRCFRFLQQKMGMLFSSFFIHENPQCFRDLRWNYVKFTQNSPVSYSAFTSTFPDPASQHWRIPQKHLQDLVQHPKHWCRKGLRSWRTHSYLPSVTTRFRKHSKRGIFSQNHLQQRPNKVEKYSCMNSESLWAFSLE